MYRIRNSLCVRECCVGVCTEGILPLLWHVDVQASGPVGENISESTGQWSGLTQR